MCIVQSEIYTKCEHSGNWYLERCYGFPRVADDHQVIGKPPIFIDDFCPRCYQNKSQPFGRIGSMVAFRRSQPKPMVNFKPLRLTLVACYTCMTVKHMEEVLSDTMGYPGTPIKMEYAQGTCGACERGRKNLSEKLGFKGHKKLTKSGPPDIFKVYCQEYISGTLVLTHAEAGTERDSAMSFGAMSGGTTSPLRTSNLLRTDEEWRQGIGPRSRTT